MAMASVTTAFTTPMGMKVRWPHSLLINPILAARSSEHQRSKNMAALTAMAMAELMSMTHAHGIQP